MTQQNVDQRGVIKKALDGAWWYTRTAVRYCTTAATAQVTVQTAQLVYWDGGSTPSRAQVDLVVNPTSFDGQTRLTWNTGLARVYDAPVGGNQLVSGQVVDVRHWRGNVPVYVEPLGVGTITLTFSLEATGTYWLGTPSTDSGDVTVVPLAIEIRATDGSAPVDWVLAPNKRSYRAVLTPPLGGGQYDWSSNEGEDLFTITAAGANATVAAAGPDAGPVKLGVTFSLDGRDIDAELPLTVFQLRIKDGDGTSEAKGHALLGEVNVPRRFAAVFEPDGEGMEIHWRAGGGQAYTIEHGTVRTAVTKVEPKQTGGTKITLTAKLDREPQDQKATVEHPFTIVDVAIKGADGRAPPPASVLKHMKQTCKAVSTPAVELDHPAWIAGKSLTVVGAGDGTSVVIAGTEKTPKESKATLSLACSLDDQSTTRQVEIAVTDIWVLPALTYVAANEELGSSVELSVQGTTGQAGHTWKPADEGAGAVILGASDKKKVTVQAKQPGEVEFEVTYDHENAIAPLTARGKVVFVGVTIKDEDGEAAPKDFSLVTGKRKYKAVPTHEVKGATFEWSCVTPRSKLTLDARGPDVTVTAPRQGTVESIAVALKLGGKTARASHEITVVDLIIKDSDGASPAKVHVLAGKQRAYRAVLDPAQEGGEFTWSKSGGAPLYEIAPDDDAATVTGAATKSGEAVIRVKCTVDGQEAEATHAFKVIDLEIKDGDGRAPPKASLLKHFKQKYKAVPKPVVPGGDFVWAEGPDISIVTGGTADVVEIAGTQKTGESGAAPLSVTYTLDGQSLTRQVAVAFTDISAPPVVVALDPKDGAIAEVEPVDTLGETGHAWDFTTNAIEATFDGGSDKKKVKIKATKPGVVEIGLAYTHALAVSPLTATGTAVFVGERVKGFQAETGAAKTLAADAGADDKKVEVLLGLARDPDVWKVGWLVAEAEGKPDRIEVTGLPEGEGEHEWKPKGGGYLQIAPAQPDADHGTKKCKVLLKALPKGGTTGPAKDPGHEADEVEVSYTLAGKAAKDKLTVKVHRYGCSAIKWHRKGSTNVDVTDRISICAHRATPQWDGKGDWTEPPGGGGIGILSSGGHQHGGRCFLCSGAASESADASPRHIWHHVPGSGRTLTEARALADAVRRYALDVADKDPAYDSFLTPALRKAIKKGKMLGVLVGTNGTGNEEWLYAISGDWPADGDWSGPISLGGKGKTKRTISSFQGSSTEYKKTQAPFNVTAMTDGWGKLGRCAAQVLLKNAIDKGLKDLELTEVWLDAKATLSTTGFIHNNEIGSCEQCRRCLGRLLCEAGA